MDNVIFENEQVSVSNDEKQHIAVIRWKQKCGNLLDEEYQPLFNQIRKHLQVLPLRKLLVDMSRCDYHLTPTSETWFDSPLYAIYSDLPAERIALIIPEKMFVTAFFDAARAYEETSQEKLQYFSDPDKAMMWLNQ